MYQALCQVLYMCSFFNTPNNEASSMYYYYLSFISDESEVYKG